MPSRQEVSYFGAGPAPLPTPVVEAGAKAFVNFNDAGLGLGEISHRSPTANKILNDAKANLSALLDIPDNYEILFMQAGGSGGFSAVVQNLVPVWIERRRRRAEADVKKAKPDAEQAEVDELVFQRLQKEVNEELKLDYLVTGSWSLKASQEASRLIGSKYVNFALDSRKTNDGKFGKIPAEDSWSLTPTKKEGGKGSAFVYFCDNETVDGVEFPQFPKSLEAQGQDAEDERLVVADMSSNFISRKVDVSKYAVIFGGAQKNIGVTGITIAIVRKDLLPPQTATPSPALLHRLNIGGLPGPTVLDYATIAKNNSLYNTLPIFNLWIAGQVMADLMTEFSAQKVSGQEEIANKKAQLIYGALDKFPQLYQVVPDVSVRSRMNICFRVGGGDDAKEKEFIAGAEKRLLQGLKGHRSVGGMRASNYNAVPLENVQKLVKYLEDFATAQ
ncbi:Phosphoserine aminotransferase [Penicillium fimorum]|uniref:phosphoserine transaminase n=1 Tax=Penicillium fimorum TaxID=1882269 RepID=A0A9W9XWT5_9EURO|nr:Phosphoserine aminotransferase [Penicillium fimorum]